jgi:hypothetical protein
MRGDRGNARAFVKTVEQFGDAEVRAAQATKLPMIATIAETNAAVSRRSRARTSR